MTPNLFGSIGIVVSRDQPGYVLPDDLPLPDDFRASFNAWAAGFFKWKPSPIPDGEVLHDKVRNVMHMNQLTFAEFRRHAA